MTDFKETALNYLDVEKYATFCSSERKWINKINRLHEQYPNDVQIIHDAESNYGMILAHIPKSWFKISPPKKMNLTDEQKQARAERLRKMRSSTKED